MLLGSSGGEENFDVLEPKSWLVESCFPMGARASSATYGTLLTFRRTRCIVINAIFLGIMRIVSVYGMCIRWRLYETARIWKLKVFLGIGRELFCLTFLLWIVCVVSSPRFRPLFKAPWEDHLPHPLALELCGSSKFLHSPWTKNMPPESWALQLRQREQRLKILLFSNRTRKSTLLLWPGTVANADCARFLTILRMPIKNVQKLAKEEGEESEAKLREAIEILEGVILAIVGSWRDPWRVTS